ncbi:putative spermidine/putrescine transport system permease protein [Rhodoligotrophos appendicifer]|uniref:ABC transporter permease n=1 Tax=Rhodoligotrophos appendicifer TaxID=987056 RepID=UPI001185BF47|nr:ABC transporter permease [Rhodoligotrophos appendicifer]
MRSPWHLPLPRLSIIISAFTTFFLLSPFLVVIGASFDTGDGFRTAFPPRSPSLQWYEAISSKYFHAAWVSFLIAVFVSILSAIVGTCAALGIVRGRVWPKDLFQSFFRLPVQIPLVVTGAVFLQFYYQLAAVTGINVYNTLYGITLAHLFVAIPYCVGCVSAVLVRVDPSLEEAAASLGATRSSTFWRVTFPQLRPGVAAGIFYAFIISFGDVPIALFLVSGDNTTLPVQIFLDMQFDFRPDMLAVSTIVVVASSAIIIVAQRFAGLDMVLPGGAR